MRATIRRRVRARLGSVGFVVVSALVAASIGVLVGSQATAGRSKGGLVGSSSAEGANYLDRVAFSTPRDGIGLFSSATRPCGFETRTTTDGGSQFSAPRPMVATSECWIGASEGDQLAVDGLGDVFVYGRSLLVSHDDGLSWSRAPLPGSIEDLVTAGSSIWALSSGHCKPPIVFYATTCRVTLYFSSNGGRSWSRPVHQPPLRVTESIVFDALVLDPSSGSVDLVVATPTGSPSTAVTLETSGDDGTTWRVERVPLGISLWESTLSVAFDGALWIVGAGEPGTGLEQKVAERSVDGGRHWTTIQMPVGGYLGGFRAQSASTAFYTGGRSPLVATFDAGRSWTAEPGFSGDASGSSEVFFASAKAGWAIDMGFDLQPVLWGTTDGGRLWARIWRSPPPNVAGSQAQRT
jgi:photosystem II stability/assembly factor-like uncharacterized protein